jgi:hypothetical protein
LLLLSLTPFWLLLLPISTVVNATLRTRVILKVEGGAGTDAAVSGKKSMHM